MVMEGCIMLIGRLFSFLNIGILQHRTSSLLAKWIWHFLHEKKVLWRRLIEAKYYAAEVGLGPCS